MAEALEHLPNPVGTPLERVSQIEDEIARGGDEAQQLRRLPDQTRELLIDEGFFRFTLPEELGGENCSAVETIEVLEAISAIDASVGWNVMLGSEINAMAAGGMPSAEATFNARLACTYGAQASMEVVDVVHASCGTSAAEMMSPLERKLRDARGAASHRWVAHPLYETMGSILFGNEADAEFAGTGGPVLGGKK